MILRHTAAGSIVFRDRASLGAISNVRVGSESDIPERRRDVRSSPKADIAELPQDRVQCVVCEIGEPWPQGPVSLSVAAIQSKASGFITHLETV